MGDNNVASIGKMLMQTQSGQSVTGVDGADRKEIFYLWQKVL